MVDYTPVKFIEEEIEVIFDQPPLLEKNPGCPDGFKWQDQIYRIVEILSEWHDYKRKGRMSRNMQPKHASRAELRGSWGVGVDYFRVRTDSNRFFDLYFDRAPRDVDHRKGEWHLYRELALVDRTL